MPSVVFNKVTKLVGFPFGIRSTCKKYLRMDIIPYVKSGKEGITKSGKSLHFFIADEEEVKFHESSLENLFCQRFSVLMRVLYSYSSFSCVLHFE